MALREALQSGNNLLLDGAMGTELGKRGLPGEWDVNLTHPGEILAIHNAYFDAGAHIATSNTLTANRIQSAKRTMADLRAINEAGVRIALEAAGTERFVLGNIGPSGRTLLSNGGDFPEQEAEEAFATQAEALIAAGAHGVIIETMTGVREALCALEAWKRHTATLPAIVSLTFQTAAKGGRTYMGDRAEDCAKQLTEAGADAVGINCIHFSADELAEIIEAFRRGTHLPIAVEPNAGMPVQAGETIRYDMTPDAFARIMHRCRDAGARIFGGCCGTTPAHIRAAAATNQQ